MSRERYTHYPRTILWLVRGGSFLMGGDEADSRPVFEVDVEPFYISKWPITNEQYQAFDEFYQRSPVSPGDRDTAVGVSHHQAAAYAEWYARVSRKPMRLPTEVEWEYACRSESTARYFWGDDPDDGDGFLWDGQNAEGKVQPADKTRPNDFGLHSMLGGVWEWTSSFYLPYPLDRRPDGGVGTEVAEASARDPEESRVLRGGSFRSMRSEISCSCRRAAGPDLVSDEVGFRIVRSFP